LKKFFIGFISFIVILLSIVYFAINSPYIIDRVARVYAPQFNFSYKSIKGNPFSGIVINNIKYKDRELAKLVKIRINPYTLLNKTLTVSNLNFKDVNVTVLEGIIKDFSSSKTKENKESKIVIPIKLELKNLSLSLLPFDIYGLKISKEELFIDSIYFDGKRFNIGNLKQIAHSSMGDIELIGTYRNRLLDLDSLSIKNFNIKEFKALLAKIKRDKSPKKRDSKVESGLIFIPSRILANSIKLNLLPYKLSSYIKLNSLKLNGSKIDIDLDKKRLVSGKLNASIISNLARANIKLHIERDSIVIDSGKVDIVELNKILALSSKSEDKKEKNTPKESVKPLDSIAFIPKYIKINSFNIVLNREKIENILVKSSKINLNGITINLHNKTILAKDIDALLNTSLFNAKLKLSANSTTLRLKSLTIKNIDAIKIQKLLKARAKAIKRVHKEKKGKKEPAKIAFLPPKLLIDRALIDIKGIKIDSIKSDLTALELRDIEINSRDLIAKKGRLYLKSDLNIARVRVSGELKNNRLILKRGVTNQITLLPKLFEIYKLPLRSQGFSPISLSGKIDRDKLYLNVIFSGRKILKDNNSTFNIDKLSSISNIDMNLTSKRFIFKSSSKVITPFTKANLNINLEGSKNRDIKYWGSIKTDGIKLNNQNLKKAFAKPKLNFRGDLKSLRAKLDAGVLIASLNSRDLKRALLVIKSKKGVKWGRYIKLPKELRGFRASFKVETPINFKKPTLLNSKIKFASNLFNLNGKAVYDKDLNINGTITPSKDSLLKKLAPKLNLRALNPIKISFKKNQESIDSSINSRGIKAKIIYLTKKEQLKGDIDIAGSKIKIEGNPKENIIASLNTSSLKRTLKRLSNIYKVEIPKLDGDLTLKLNIKKLSKVSLELKSKKFVPDNSLRIKSPIKDIDLVLEADIKKGLLSIQKYNFKFGKMKIFATKSSLISLKKSRINIESFWVNDSLKVTGWYDTQREKGEILAKSNSFHLIHKNADIKALVDIKAKIIQNRIDIKGKATILGGKLFYNIEKKHYASDSDIIIIQHQKKRSNSFFKKSVQITLYIDSKAPLVFKERNVLAKLSPQLSIIKAYDSNLQLLGSVTIKRGGYYILNGKRFILKDSSINFTGKATNPLLDINLVYNRYGKSVFISVNGSATEPNINFSSDPYMNRAQILSFIMFGDENFSGNAEDMAGRVGGEIAKSILRNLGLKVDTLIVSTEGFEIGKRISNKITILFKQKTENPKVIVRVEYSKTTETDISIGNNSQSIDIIYKKEF